MSVSVDYGPRTLPSIDPTLRVSAFTATAGKLHKIDATEGNVPIALPAITAAIHNAIIAFKKYGAEGEAGITPNLTDTIDGTTGGDAVILTEANQYLEIKADNDTKNWIVVATVN